MKKLTNLVAAIYLIVSIVSTTTEANAKIIELTDLPSDVVKLLLTHGYDGEDWLLIEEKTLIPMLKDADGYTLALENTVAAQKELNKAIKVLNLTQKAMYELRQDGYDKDVEIYKLKNPIWYKHRSFWGTAGLAGGVILTVAALAAGGVI